MTPVDGDGPLERASHLSHRANLREGSRSNAWPYFVPRHFLAFLGKLQIDHQLFSIPVQRAIGVGVEVASCRTRIVAEHSAKAIRGLVPPVQCNQKHFSSGPAYVLFF